MLRIKTAGFEDYLDSTNGAWIKCLVLGDHGVGKTPSAARWPDPIIADCEHGIMSVASIATPYATIENSRDMDELLDFLKMDSKKPAESRKYRTLVIDTVDSYQRLLISERLKSERKEALSGWADWGWLGGKGAQLIERLLNLPINVVVNMHVKDKRDDDGESTMLVKDNPLKGDLSETIYRDFDLIGLMEKSYVSEGGERVLKRQIRWHSEPKFPMLRDRSGKLPRFTDIDFTGGDYQRIFDHITDGVDQLPASITLEEIGEKYGTPADVPAPDEPGGPMQDMKLPKQNPVKKTAAKKAPAKKAESEPAKVEKSETGTPVDEKADTEAVMEAKSETDLDGDAAVDLVKEALGGEVVEETTTPPEVEQIPAEQKAAEEAVDPSGSAAKTAQVCGTVPPGLDGDPSLGCGKDLTPNNSLKRQMAQLRTKTLICDDCFEKWKADH